MTLSHLITELASVLGLTNFKLDENHCARLLVDQESELNFEFDEAQQSLQIYTVLGTAPVENRLELFTHLLKGNLFGHETGGATLSYDESSNELLLHRTLTGENWDTVSLTTVLESFIAATNHWKQGILEAPTASIITEDTIPTTFVRA